jgi:hypothetical protein
MAVTRRERGEATQPAWVQAYQDHRRRYEEWSRFEARLRSLVPTALDVLERALDDPEQGLRLALAVLRAVGLWGLQRVTEPNPVLYQLSVGLSARLASDLGTEAER